MQIVAIAPNVWSGQWMNRQHLMWALKDYVPVAYVQEPALWHQGWRRRDENFFTCRTTLEDPALTVLRLPKALCRRGRAGRWNDAADWIKAGLVQRRVSDRGPVVMYLWHPELWPYVRRLKPVAAVFHLYDLCPEYYRPEHRDNPVQEFFREACREADFVITGTEHQARSIPREDVTVVPNGAPFEWYCQPYPEPVDVVDIPHPRIGYVGTISNKLDLGWIERLAAVRPWQIVLVGPLRLPAGDALIRFQQLCQRGNVHYLGNKAADVVPAYVHALDVGLMSYTRGLHCETSSPLKLFEYSAAGIPIVGSRLQSLVTNSEASYFARLVDTPDEAADAVAAALEAADNPQEREARIAFARRNSWRRRAAQIMRLLRPLADCDPAEGESRPESEMADLCV